MGDLRHNTSRHLPKGDILKSKDFTLVKYGAWFLMHHAGGDLVTKSCPTLATPWTVAHQAPLSTDAL